MTRKFADLHLRVNPKDYNQTQQAIGTAARLGYRYIGIPSTSAFDSSEVDALRDKYKNTGLDFVSRIDFKPKSQEDLMHFLRKFRRKVEVICIVCDSKEVARQAAKDRRVDLLNFPSFDYHKRFFDRAEAELASCSLAALEIDAKSLLVLSGSSRVRLLSSLRREVALASEFHVPVVISSGVSEEFLMRNPRDLASLSYLFGLQELQALDAVSTNPKEIVLRNREKLDSKFVAPGIKVLKEGVPT